MPPHDKNVIREVEKIAGVEAVKWGGGESNISMIGAALDEAYIGMVRNLSVYPKWLNVSIIYV